MQIKEENKMDTVQIKTYLNNISVSPQVVFRGFRGEEDYPVILAMINGCKAYDKTPRSDTLEEVANNYAHLHNCDPYQDMLFAEVEGQAAGYCRLWWDISGEGEFIGSSFGVVLPEQRKKGIGTAFLGFIESRLRVIADELAEKGELSAGAPRLVRLFASESEQDKEHLLQKNSFQATRHSCEMVRPSLEQIPDLPLPEGLEVRPVLEEHYHQIWAASQEAFQDHWGFVHEPYETFENMLRDPNTDPSIWQVAWEGNEVAGMVLNFINKQFNEEYNRQRGYTESISVRRPWRRRGLAKALIARSLALHKELGMEEAALGVDAENLSGALQLYMSMGYGVVKRHTFYQKQL
jgi:mycothiol synthase